MADIWGRTIELGGVVPGEKVRVEFKNSSSQDIAVGMIATTVRIETARELTRVMDLKSGKLWLVGPLPQLVLAVISGLIVTPTEYKSFAENFGSLCATGNYVDFKLIPPSCTTGLVLTHRIYEPKLRQISDAVSVEGLLVLGNVVLAGNQLELLVA